MQALRAGRWQEEKGQWCATSAFIPPVFCFLIRVLTLANLSFDVLSEMLRRNYFVGGLNLIDKLKRTCHNLASSCDICCSLMKKLNCLIKEQSVISSANDTVWNALHFKLIIFCSYCNKSTSWKGVQSEWTTSYWQCPDVTRSAAVYVLWWTPQECIFLLWHFHIKYFK